MILFTILLTSIVYIFTFHASLGQKTSVLSFIFALLFWLLYYFWLKGSASVSMTIARLILFGGIIIFNAINFIYFQQLGSYIFLGSGLITTQNSDQLNQLIQYFYGIPFFFLVVTLGALVVLGILEVHNLKKIRPAQRAKNTLGFIGLLILLIFVAQLVSIFPKKTWASTRSFHEELGPYGFFAVEVQKNIIHNNISQKSLADFNPTSETKKILAQLSALPQSSSPQTQGQRLPSFTDPPNIVLYQLESVSSWAINQNPSPMPFLKNLMQDNISVDQFYANGCHTIEAEFTSLCSILPSSQELISSRLKHPDYYCLPEQLKNTYGYKTSAYHSNVQTFWNRDILFPQWGIDNNYFSPYFKPKTSDNKVIDQLVNHLIQSVEPTLAYIIGYTSHSPYTEEQILANFYDNNLTIQPYQDPLNDVAKNISTNENELRNYLGFLTAVDNSIKHLFELLEETGQLDNTIVVLYGDHRYFTFENEVDYFREYNEIPFAMYVPGITHMTIDTIATHSDIAPSIIDLLGFSDASNSFVGISIFSSDHYNQAIGKCVDDVMYVNPEIQIQGTLSLDLFTPVGLTAVESNKLNQYTTLFKDVLDASDKIMNYPDHFDWPDGTLVQEVANDNVYILFGNKKHLILNDALFKELGFLWQDVHILPSQQIDIFQDGKRIIDRSTLASLTNTNGTVQATAATFSVLKPDSGYAQQKLIAQSLGVVRGANNCNCSEAFEQTYRNGFRIFEADVAKTVDNQIVLFQEGKEDSIDISRPITNITRAEFKQKKWLGSLTLLDLDAFIELLDNYPDTYVVIDADPELTIEILQKIEIQNEAVASRIIPQTYSEEGLRTLLDYKKFSDVVFNNSQLNLSTRELYILLKTYPEITSITLSDIPDYSKTVVENINNLGASCFIQNQNDSEIVSSLLDLGFGVYTDFYSSGVQ